MAENEHLPKLFLKVNRHGIPYLTLYVNFIVGACAFLPFPGWQKLVAFLSSASILSYGIGPICLLAMRKLQPDNPRPFKLAQALLLSHIAFYICNLMLYWCGFSVIWKLDMALIIGLSASLFYQKKNPLTCGAQLFWFLGYMAGITLFSAFGAFGGLGLIKFPYDTLYLLPFSIIMLSLSQRTTLRVLAKSKPACSAEAMA